MPPIQSPADLKVELDRCVKCGLCLPDCPTYRLETNENESPRGRLALIEGLVNGRLKATDSALQRHLDSCLLCRRCERVCPSGVAYGAIFDNARSVLAAHRPRSRLAALVEHPNMLRSATLAARIVPTWLTGPFPALQRIHRLGRALYAEPPPAPGTYPAIGQSARGRVGLFSGCATAAQQGGALLAARVLLQHAGFEVQVPAGAACCGALAAHAGDQPRARALAARNRQAFDASLDAVVSIASGCGIHLDVAEPALAAPHTDICRFLVQSGGLSSAELQPRAQRVLLHTPCSVENVYRGKHWPTALLSRVPELDVVPIGAAGECCGSAGDYLLRHAATAARLREPLLDAAADSGADVLLTTNVGCAMHIAAGLAGRRHRIEVLHPVELLARQLRQ